jgi:mevalonate kinase
MREASASAKIILVGEHAVVYGQPAIAVPVSSLRAVADVEANRPSGQGLRIVAADAALTLDSHPDNPLVITAKLVLRALDAPAPDITITVRSQIPVASGLGSGAAVSTALARALSAACNHPLDNETLNAIIYEVEKIHHGTPSGIDNTVIVYEQPVYFIRNQPIERVIIGAPFSLLIANTGIAASTRTAVADVRKLYETQPQRIRAVIEEIGALVVKARQAIETRAFVQLGLLMQQNHRLLQQLTVSSRELDTLVNAAMKVGALGAKLSGGGRGGNMIALVTPETAGAVQQALFQAGAVSVFATTVE